MIRIRRLLREESGAVMVLVAIALLVLLGCMALVIDAGVVYAERMKASNAVDAAVLAGVRELPSSALLARQKAEEYAQNNGLEPSDPDNGIQGQVSFDIDPSPQPKWIKGIVDYEKPMLFARIFNIDIAEIKPSAKAMVGVAGGVSPGSGVVPLGVKEGTFSVGEQTVLKWRGGGGTNGWYGCLDLDTDALTGDKSGGGADTYREYLKNGYDKWLYIKDCKYVETGSMQGPTDTGIQTRMTSCANHCGTTPVCTAENHKEDCPRVVIVPVGTASGDPGSNNKFTITGFGAFFIESKEEVQDTIDGNKTKNIHLTGTFLKVVVPGEISTGVNDFGVYSYQMCE